MIEDERLEFEKLHRLQKRIRSASPWRALQNEDNFWVISQVAGDDEMRLDIRVKWQPNECVSSRVLQGSELLLSATS